MAIRRDTITSTQYARGAGAECPPKGPACPVCGQLECLCRPRFFAGQLLTEDDLRRLERYIVEKNKLHNRYLHGWGTVCGLEVSCHPCGDRVQVSAGYAIDRCGNDIVVCDPDTVDICELIKRCKKPDKLDCRPYKDPGDCPDLEEKWILAIRYCERPSRGVAALRSSGATGCASCGSTSSCSACGGCAGCGGSAGCSCQEQPSATCGADGTWTPSRRLPKRSSPPECEPTVTCESYVYEIYKLEDDGDCTAGRGQLSQRLLCCVEALFGSLTIPPGDLFDTTSYQDMPKAWHQWCCATKQALREWSLKHPGFDCDVSAKLQLLVCPDPGSTDFAQQMGNAVKDLITVFLEAVDACLCSALLPPCPEPASDARVALASVTVRTSDCHVVRVCNWTPCRRFAVTMPMLRYWLGVLPFGSAIRDLVHQMCCDLFSSDFAGSAPISGDYAGQQMYPEHDSIQTFGRMVTEAASRQGEVSKFALGANALGRNAAGYDTLLQPDQRQLLPQFLLLDQIARPVFNTFVQALSPQHETATNFAVAADIGIKSGSGGAGAPDTAAKSGAASAGAQDIAASSELQKRLEQLQKQVEEQAARITILEAGKKG